MAKLKAILSSVSVNKEPQGAIINCVLEDSQDRKEKVFS